MEPNKQHYPVGTIGYLANQLVADMKAARKKPAVSMPAVNEVPKRVSKRFHCQALKLEKPKYSTSELRSLKNGAIGSNALLSNMFVVSRALPPTAWSANDDSGDVFIQTEDIPEMQSPPPTTTTEVENRSQSHRRRRSRKKSGKKRRSRETNEPDSKRRKGN